MTRAFRRLVPPFDAPSSPAWSLAYILGASFVFHLGMIMMVGWDADSPASVLCAVILAGLGSGLYAGRRGHGPATAVLAAAWPAALFAWRRWYWAMDMHSPGGTAQWLIGLTGWADAPAPGAVALVAAGAAVPGWSLARFDRWSVKRTGRSLFDED